MRQPSPARQTGIIWKLARKLLKGAAALLALLVCGVLAIYLYTSWNLPSVDALKTTEELKAFHRFGEQSAEQLVLLPLSEIPPHTLNAFIAASDPDFAGRSFFDGGMFAADLSRYLLFARQKKVSHLENAVLQLNIALFLNREEILSAWLATTYFGKNTSGLSAAAKKYCDKPVSELTMCESVMLASITKAPVYNPIDAPDRARQQQQTVLDKMTALGLASGADLEECLRDSPLPD